MSQNKVVLGAPSLTGKDANDLVKAAFKGLKYPAKIRFTNLIGMALSFPEVHGLFLKPVGHDGEESVVVEIKDDPAFQRLASSIEQIAELNGKEQLLEVEVYDAEAEAKAKAAAQAEAEAKAKADAGKPANSKK
ncbi:MAG: hypothetical protein ACXWT0_00265 [Methylobacter sp.]